MLELNGILTNNVVTMTSKSMYKSFVKILNKDELNGRADTPWRAHFGLDSEVKHVWRALYKLPLTKKKLGTYNGECYMELWPSVLLFLLLILM